MPVYNVDNIQWDLDGDDTPEELDLPTSTIIVAGDYEDVAQVLSDKYGFCILSLDAYEEKAFRVGQSVRVSDCSGIYSNCEAVVIQPVPWNKVPGMYQMPDRDMEKCLRRVSDDRVFYMYTNRLTHI